MITVATAHLIRFTKVSKIGIEGTGACVSASAGREG